MEAKVVRLERIAKLFVKAGLRYRRDLRRREEKFNVVVDVQIGYAEKLAKLNQKTEDVLIQLTDGQAATDRKVENLIKRLSENGQA